jgi:hypothetical protein
VESGKKNQRPQLLAAMADARAVGGVLLIAKLDRLSRNASFILTLRDAGIDFVCCDMPDANTLTVGLFAVLAQCTLPQIRSQWLVEKSVFLTSSYLPSWLKVEHQAF